MESAKRAYSSFIYGLKDCICGMLPILKILFHQQDSQNVNVQRTSVRHGIPQGTVRDKLISCAIFGICFWFSNLVFNRFFMQYFFHLLVEWTGEDVSSNLVTWNRRILYSTFCVLYIFPLLAVSKLLNFIWYQDVADLILAQSGVKKNTNIRISDFFADLIKSCILQMFYYFQANAAYFLPLNIYVQHIWYLLHMSLLTSLYAFEYKWVHLGWPLHRRLLNINRKWPYYLGFGIPLALITTWFDSVIDGIIVFATVFPTYVVSSAVTPDAKSPIFSHPFNSFRIADSVSDVFISSIMKISAVGLAFFGR